MKALLRPIFRTLMARLKRPALRPHVLSAILTPEEAGLLRLADEGYLQEIGWIRSSREQRCVDLDGNPIPWCTYPYIAFMRQRLRNDLRLFEYGSGFSTRFYAARVASVTAVEHDRDWYDKVRAELPSNAELLYRARDENGEYCRAVLAGGKTYDVIVVDGRDRVNCLRQCLPALAPAGVIVLDNSQRPRYAEGLAFLYDHGFRRLDFEGLSPMKSESNTTTLFYRPDNILGI